MKKSSINGLLIGALILDSAIIYTLVKRYNKGKNLLEKSDKKYIKLDKNEDTNERLSQDYTNRVYTKIGTIEKKKAM